MWVWGSTELEESPQTKKAEGERHLGQKAEGERHGQYVI